MALHHVPANLVLLDLYAISAQHGAYFARDAVIELVLIVCLTNAPGKCDTVYLRQDGPASMMQCLFNGAKQAAKWAEEHPGYVFRRWNCGHPRA